MDDALARQVVGGRGGRASLCSGTTATGAAISAATLPSVAASCDQIGELLLKLVQLGFMFRRRAECVMAHLGDRVLQVGDLRVKIEGTRFGAFGALVGCCACHPFRSEHRFQFIRWHRRWHLHNPQQRLRLPRA